MMDATCLGYRPSIAQDVARGTTQDPFRLILGSTQPGGVLAGVPCSVQETGVDVKLFWMQRNAVVDTTIYFIQDPGLEPNDIAVVTDRTGNTTTYKVKGRAQPVGRGVLWHLQAEHTRAPR
jgi:hypothetical protein